MNGGGGGGAHFANGQQTVCRRRHFDIRKPEQHDVAAIRNTIVYAIFT